MQSISLTSLASEKLAEAQQSHSGRAAHTIHGGHAHELRQTVLARQPRKLAKFPGLLERFCLEELARRTAPAASPSGD